MRDKNKILEDLKKILNSNFPDLIDKIILFGSQANGRQKEYSDYDILIILKKDYDWELENLIIDACYDVDLKYDIVTDIKIISTEELNLPRGRQTYIQKALTDGIYA